MSNVIFLYLYILIIFLLSSIPPNIVNSIQLYGIDKIIHLIEYLLLGIIFKTSIRYYFSKHYFLILTIPIIDEFLIQRFSGRNVDFYDFITNILGLFIGLILFEYFYKRDKIM